MPKLEDLRKQLGAIDREIIGLLAPTPGHFRAGRQGKARRRRSLARLRPGGARGWPGARAGREGRAARRAGREHRASADQRVAVAPGTGAAAGGRPGPGPSGAGRGRRRPDGTLVLRIPWIAGLRGHGCRSAQPAKETSPRGGLAGRIRRVRAHGSRRARSCQRRHSQGQAPGAPCRIDLRHRFGQGSGQGRVEEHGFRRNAGSLDPSDVRTGYRPAVRLPHIADGRRRRRRRPGPPRRFSAARWPKSCLCRWTSTTG